MLNFKKKSYIKKILTLEHIKKTLCFFLSIILASKVQMSNFTSNLLSNFDSGLVWLSDKVNDILDSLNIGESEIEISEDLLCLFGIQKDFDLYLSTKIGLFAAICSIIACLRIISMVWLILDVTCWLGWRIILNFYKKYF